VSQNADNTLWVVPDDTAVLGTSLQRVQVNSGLPSVTLKVASGARCMVGFMTGDTGELPYVASFMPASTDASPISGTLTSMQLGGSALTSLQIGSTSASTVVNIGSAAQFAALANLVDQNFKTISQLLSSGLMVTTTGTAAAQTGTAIGNFSPTATACTLLKTS